MGLLFLATDSALLYFGTVSKYYMIKSTVSKERRVRFFVSGFI